jgi:AcrR family transcriptional regulator
MPPASDRRAALLDAMADHMLSAGLAASSLRPLAKAAGTSDRMLLYYFPTKDALVEAVLAHVAQRQAELLAADMSGPLPLETLRRVLAERLFAPEIFPYMRLWLEVAAGAATGDPLLRRAGEAIARGFLAWGEAQLEGPPGPHRSAQAARLLVTLEGMLFLKSIGLEDVAKAALATPDLC